MNRPNAVEIKVGQIVSLTSSACNFGVVIRVNKKTFAVKQNAGGQSNLFNLEPSIRTYTGSGHPFECRYVAEPTIENYKEATGMHGNWLEQYEWVTPEINHAILNLYPLLQINKPA